MPVVTWNTTLSAHSSLTCAHCQHALTCANCQHALTSAFSYMFACSISYDQNVLFSSHLSVNISVHITDSYIQLAQPTLQ